jgi:hypothetical protein
MKTVTFGTAVILAIAGFALSASFARNADVPASTRVPVLAELFTSEGCSSCPPADDLLRRLITDQPVEGVEVVGVSEHVDYWNRLGWKDPFSSSRFSERQHEYAKAFGTDRVYTPQLVVDGRVEVVGSDWPAVRRAIAGAARTGHATLTVAASRLANARSVSIRVEIDNLSHEAATGSVHVIVAVVEDDLTSSVLRGENAHRRLRHSAVVRSLESIATLAKGVTSGEFTRELELDLAWGVDHLRAIAFLQDARTRHVVGVGTTSIR